MLGAGLLAVGCADGANYPAGSKATSTAVAPIDTGVRGADWANVEVPASVCGGEGSVTLKDGDAVVSSTRWPDAWEGNAPSSIPSQVRISQEDPVAYGDVDGDGLDEAVVGIWCDNGGGTAGGQLGQSLVVFTGAAERPSVLGILDTTQPSPGRAPYFDSGATRIAGGSITARELYFGPSAYARLTAQAETTWSWNGTALVRGDTRIIETPA